MVRRRRRRAARVPQDAGAADRAAPRLACDLTGDGTTVLHASAGLFHNARLGGGSSRQPAQSAVHPQPDLYLTATIGIAARARARLADRPGRRSKRSSWDYETPSSYNWSLGVGRDIGWGTVVDVAYVGSVGRHLEMEYEHQRACPDGARFLDLQPAEPRSDATERRAAAGVPAAVSRLSGHPHRAATSGTSNYHSLQLQVNRRYIRGMQFGGAYTWQRARGMATRTRRTCPLRSTARSDLHYALARAQPDHNASDQLHAGTCRTAAIWNNALTRGLLDGWQLSGENAFVSGEWARVTFTTADNFDFTGGDGGTGQPGGPIRWRTRHDCLRVVRPSWSGDPMPRGSAIRSRAGSTRRPSRGRRAAATIGNAPRNVVQRPGINNWNLSLFKNFRLGGTPRLQFRVEVYNVLNHTQFHDIDRTRISMPTGCRSNPNFGTAIGIATPTRPARVVQMSARFNF